MATISVNAGMTYTQLNDAINTATAGDTVEFSPGTYDEYDPAAPDWRKCTAVLYRKGTEENPIVIKSSVRATEATAGDDTHHAIIDIRPLISVWPTVTTYGFVCPHNSGTTDTAYWITIDGFEFRGSPTRGNVPWATGVSVGQYVHDIDIQYCLFRDLHGQAIGTAQARDVRIDNNTFYNCGWSNNHIDHYFTHFHAIYIGDSHITVDYENHEITNNVFHDCCSPIWVNPNQGIGDRHSSGILIDGNVGYNNRGYFIGVSYIWDSRITNNVCYRSVFPSTTYEGGAYDELESQIKFNTMSGEVTDYADWAPRNNIIANNTVVNFVGSYAGIQIDIGSKDNVIINNAVLSGGGQINDQGTNNTKLHNYLSTYSAPLAESLFSDPEARNFIPRSSSALVGGGARYETNSVSGIKYAPTTDYAGNPRPIPNPGGTWDIGAYQYGADGYSWPYYVIRPNGFETNEWSWTPSADVTFLQRDPDSVYGWTGTALDSYMYCGELSGSSYDREWFSLENWDANWPQEGYIHNIRVKFRVMATNIAALLGVSLYSPQLGKGYLADATFTTKEDGSVIQHNSWMIEQMPSTPSLCWAEFRVPQVTAGKYTRFSPTHINGLVLKIVGDNPDGASSIKVYAIEASCFRTANWWKRKTTIYTPAQT